MKITHATFLSFCRFQAGYSSCAQEAASFLLSTPGVDVTVGQRLLAHLSTNMANPIASALQATRTTPSQQPLPPAVPLTSTPVTRSSPSPMPSSDNSKLLRRSSSPNLSYSSPSKRLFHSPPLTTPTSNRSPQPPRPSSTPAASANNYSLTVSILKDSEDEDTTDFVGGQAKIIKPSPIRLNPNDPVWRPF